MTSHSLGLVGLLSAESWTSSGSSRAEREAGRLSVNFLDALIEAESYRCRKKVLRKISRKNMPRIDHKEFMCATFSICSNLWVKSEHTFRPGARQEG